MAIPAFWLTIREGMVGTKPAVTPMPATTVPPVLLATITPTAPLSRAFCALTEKPHTPRSTRAILPAMEPAFGQEFAAQANVGPAQQPSASVPAPVTPSLASTTSLVVENWNGPQPAVPTGKLPAIAAGALIVTAVGAPVFTAHTPCVRAASGVSVPRPFRRSTVSPKISDEASLSAPGCHA